MTQVSMYLYPSNDLFINPQGILTWFDQNDTKTGDKSGLQQESPVKNTIKEIKL